MYPDEFYGDIPEELLYGVVGIFLFVMLTVLAVRVTFYVLRSLGLYTMAKRREIHNPWLAWLPVGDYWIAGSLSDQYRYVTEGRVKNRRILLLVVALVSGLISNAASVLSMGGMMDYMEYLMQEELGVSGEVLLQMSQIGAMLSIPNAVVGLALFVFWQMTLYDIYQSCDPNNSTVYLILGIVIGVTVPIFLFANRKKELGMPPRRPAPACPDETPWELD